MHIYKPITFILLKNNYINYTVKVKEANIKITRL